MRSYSIIPSDGIESIADTVQRLAIESSSGQAMDWAGAASARAANAHLVRFTGMSSAGVAMNFIVNLVSTHAAVPSSGSSITTGTTAGSTGNNYPVLGSRIFQIPAWSTGFSVASLSSGHVIAEVWKR